MRRLLLLLSCACALCGLTLGGAGASGSAYWDHSGYFTFVAPSYWRLQVSEGSDTLTVFYGRGGQDLLYFERLGPVKDETPAAFAERVLGLYGTPYGPDEFSIREDIETTEVGGVEAARAVYEFAGSSGETIRELRYFIVVDGIGFTITYADGDTSFSQGLEYVEPVLDSWRWLTVD